MNDYQRTIELARAQRVQTVWAYVSQHPTATLDEIARDTGCGRTACQVAIKALKRAGYIEHDALTARARRVVVPLVTSGFRVVARRHD